MARDLKKFKKHCPSELWEGFCDIFIKNLNLHEFGINENMMYSLRFLTYPWGHGGARTAGWESLV